MGIDTNEDKLWMQQAYRLALQAQSLQEVPVGAVVISENKQLLGSAHNQVITRADPCAHAEILAIRQAAAAIGNHRLENCSIYVTLEPCAMCAGALVHARVKRLIFAVRDFKTGAAGSVCNLLQGKPLNHRVQIDEGIMEEECSLLLTEFFQQRR